VYFGIEGRRVLADLVAKERGKKIKRKEKKENNRTQLVFSNVPIALHLKIEKKERKKTDKTAMENIRKGENRKKEKIKKKLTRLGFAGRVGKEKGVVRCTAPPCSVVPVCSKEHIL